MNRPHGSRREREPAVNDGPTPLRGKPRERGLGCSMSSNWYTTSATPPLAGQRGRAGRASRQVRVKDRIFRAKGSRFGYHPHRVADTMVRQRESSCLLLVRNAVAFIRGPGHAAAIRSAVTDQAWSLSTQPRGNRRKHSARLRMKRGVLVSAGSTKFRYKQARLRSGTDYIGSMTHITKLVRVGFQILARSS